MKAPEKLYLRKRNKLPLEVVRDKWYETDHQSIYGSVEYIRADYAEKEFLIKAKRFLSEIHRVCDITDENGYRIELRDLQARFENFYKETKI